jgi:preprotein translocase subunit SecF
VAELSEQLGARAPEVAEARPRERRLDIVGQRNWYFLVSLLVIIPGLVSIATRGFLLGIDFAGGTEYSVKFVNKPTLQQVSAAVSAEGINATVQQTGNGGFVIRSAEVKPSGQEKFKSDLTAKLGPIAPDSSFIAVSGVVARETVLGAGGAVLAASLLILIYLAFRFRRVQGGWRAGMQFGGSALLALLHDVAVLTGIFSILGKVLGLRIGEIDSLFLTAVLTVVGFSVHDTIVVFDRIRENLIVSSRLTFDQVVNLSIMQTANRSLITSFTVVLVLLSLLLFGGDTLRGLTLALLIGIVSGAYSSIFNAAPLLVVWRRLQPVR